jgi:hypothetical protein
MLLYGDCRFNVIFVLVFFNICVPCLVSCPKYANDSHLSVLFLGFCLRVMLVSCIFAVFFLWIQLFGADFVATYFSVFFVHSVKYYVC